MIISESSEKTAAAKFDDAVLYVRCCFCASTFSNRSGSVDPGPGSEPPLTSPVPPERSLNININAKVEMKDKIAIPEFSSTVITTPEDRLLVSP